MTIAPIIASELGVAAELRRERGSVWMRPATLDVRGMARTMHARAARLVTITASQLDGDAGIELAYHWDLDGELLTILTVAADKRIPTIRDIYRAADWVEREIHEYFAVEFEGVAHDPLLLRPEEAPGVNLREEDE